MHVWSRPLLCLLLVGLLATWGSCPCVYAQIFEGGDEADGGPAETPKSCCCCKTRSPARDGPRKGDPEPDDDCPCCASGAWMRDLPPQVHDLEPDVPGAILDDLPPTLLGPTLAVIVPHDVPEAVGPPRPSAQRPHAAPVGIVRLLD